MLREKMECIVRGQSRLQSQSGDTLTAHLPRTQKIALTDEARATKGREKVKRLGAFQVQVCLVNLLKQVSQHVSTLLEEAGVGQA